MEKIVLTAQELLEDSFRLGARVLKSGFEPTMIVAIWRGGAPVGMAVQELIRYCGVETDHIAIRTSSYVGVDQRKTEVAVFGLNYILNKVVPEDRLLIVDDVFDTGNTIAAVIKELGEKARGNMPRDIRIAVPWYKPSRNQTAITPDYWVHETDKWIVFPHELDALSPEEMKEQRPALHALFAKYEKGTT
ncbi:MAG: hypoxanthine phosphoribosyltransferase [Gammaproteobacteria bacterium]|nr:hypoxanthine phosphoribosyltransferase [Gammaproteobacteria bacterium]